jgi:hypothetical protein
MSVFVANNLIQGTSGSADAESGHVRLKKIAEAKVEK